MNKYIHNLFSEHFVGSTTKWFVRFVYGWFVLFFILYASDISAIWGTNSALIRYSAADTPVNNFVYILMYQLHWFWIVAALHLIAAILSFMNFWQTSLFRIIVWVTGVLLYFSGIPAMNSGYLFMLLLAFYCIPFVSRPKMELHFFLNRIVLFTCKLQLYLVYVFSAIFKVTSKQWLSGEALYYTFTSDRFSPEWIKKLSFYSPFWVIIILAYFIMVFQLFFPIWSIWNKTRKWAIYIGVLMHIYIGLVMGLWDFALAMLIPYLLLVQTTGQKIDPTPHPQPTL
ncbi:MAG: hypothetical protein ACKO8Q_04980 [Bacteroidota bacterium]